MRRPACPTLAQPNFAQAVAQNDVIFRIPISVFGDGLVENTTDTQPACATPATPKKRAR
jgi:hypothetical protein